jgi:hypothetical protein
MGLQSQGQMSPHQIDILKPADGENILLSGQGSEG